MRLPPCIAAFRMPQGPWLILGTALTSFGVLLLGRALLNRLPEPNPATSPAQLEAERLWSTDPERRRLAALLLSSRHSHQPERHWSLLRSQGWGSATLAPVAIKQQALAAEQLGRQDEADRLWQQLETRFPQAASTADALYALGRDQPTRRSALLTRFPSHPAALAAALEQATDKALTPTQRLRAVRHLARSGPRWPGAREVLLEQCARVRGTANAAVRQDLAVGLARLGDGTEARHCLDQSASTLTNAADTLTIATSLLQGPAAADPALAADGRRALIGLLERWPSSVETDAALRLLADDPSSAGLEALQDLPQRWRQQAPVQARLALAGLSHGRQVLQRWPDDPASWELRWQLTRRALLQRRWQEVRTLLERPQGQPLPAPLAAREHFWLATSLERLGEPGQARSLWRALQRQEGSGYYGWRASVRLGEIGLTGRLGTAQASALLQQLDQRVWTPLASGDPELDRLWQAGQALEAWEHWLHRRRGQPSQTGDDLRREGLLRLGVGDDGLGLERLERASLRLRLSCEDQDHLERALHPLRFQPEFRRAALGNGLHPALLLGVAKAESQFQPKARSPVGAIGLLQLMPETARDVAGAPLTEATLEEPGRNSQLGARYLRQLLNQWRDALLPTVASYNAGAGAVATWDLDLLKREPELWVEQIPYPETRLYVKKVLGNAWSYQKLNRSNCRR